MRKISLGLMAFIVAVFIGACGVGPDESREDARDTAGASVDRTAPEVVAFNNQFPNVQHKCDRSGHRIFVVSHNDERNDGDLFKIIADPTCPGYTRETAVAAAIGAR